MGQNNQKDQKGPKMTAAVMLVQNNQNNQKIWSSQISYTILKVRFFWDTLYMLVCECVCARKSSFSRQMPLFQHFEGLFQTNGKTSPNLPGTNDRRPNGCQARSKCLSTIYSAPCSQYCTEVARSQIISSNLLLPLKDVDLLFLPVFALISNL